VILDASVGVEIAVGSEAGRRALKRLPDNVFVPELFYAEVPSILRRLVALRKLSTKQADAAHESICGPVFTALPVHHLHSEIWRLSTMVSAYDAHYVVLARETDMVLLTCDRRLATHRRLGISCELIHN
jgi:predicted nucleic acid-binding protein